MKKLKIMICFLVLVTIASCTENINLSDSSNFENIIERQFQALSSANYVKSDISINLKAEDVNININPLVTTESVKRYNNLVTKVNYHGGLGAYGLGPIEFILDDQENKMYTKTNDGWFNISLTNPNYIVTQYFIDINYVIFDLLSNPNNVEYIDSVIIGDVNQHHFKIKISLYDTIKSIYDLFYDKVANEYNEIPTFDTIINDVSVFEYIMKDTIAIINDIEEISFDVYLDDTGVIKKINFDMMQMLDVIEIFKQDFIILSRRYSGLAYIYDYIVNYQNILFSTLDIFIFDEIFEEFSIGITIDYRRSSRIGLLPYEAKDGTKLLLSEFLNIVEDFQDYNIDRDIIGKEYTNLVTHSTEPIIYYINQYDKSFTKYNIETRKLNTIKLNASPLEVKFLNNKIYILLFDYNRKKGSYAVVNANNINDYKIYNIDIFPNDIAIDNDGYVYITYHDSYLEIYNQKGKLQATKPIYYNTFIEYNSALDKIYLTSTYKKDSKNIQSLKYNKTLNKVVYDNSVYSDKLSNNSIISPDGKYLFNHGGYIYKCNDQDNFEHVATLNVKYIIKDLTYAFDDIAFNISNNEFYLLRGKYILTYSYDTLTLKSEIETGSAGSLFFYNNKFYLISSYVYTTSIRQIEIDN